MAAAQNLTIGIDLGGTNAQIGVVEGARSLAARIGIKTKAGEGCEAVLDRLAEGIAKVCEQASARLDDIVAVGIAAPGAIDMPNGVVLEAPNLGWHNVPLRDFLVQRIGRPVVVDNDVNAAAWGEFRLGAAQGEADCLGVWLGTGVGGGIILNGRLHHGSLFTAGEFGQQVILPEESHGRRFIEDHCSRTGMSRLIRAWSVEFPDSKIASHNQSRGFITSNESLASAWNAGDALATKIVEHAARLLGVGIANAVTLLAVGCVVIGGGVTESLGQSFVNLVRQSFDAEVFPQANRRCRIVMTTLAEDAGLLGAAMLADNVAQSDSSIPESI